MFPRTREVPPPLVRELAAGGIPVAAGVPGSGDRAPAVLPVARRPGHRRRTRGGVPGERPVRRPPRGPGVRLPVPRRRSPRCGESMSDRTAWRICSTNRWWSVFGKKRGSKKGRSGPPVHDDLVGRVFTADAPNTLWLTDIPPSTPCREVPPPNTEPRKASSTCVRSRTCTRTGSSATRSAIG